jgi:transposase-like protein
LPKSVKSTLPKRIDWPAAHAEYVNNAGLTYADIAAKYGINPSALRMRAGREQWTDQRQAAQAKLLQKVTEKTIHDTVAELAKYNEQDLIAAKALRSLAARQMQAGNLEPKDVRALAGAIESAQRIARLALGASTENTELSGSVAVQRITDRLLAGRQRLLEQPVAMELVQ